MRALCFHPGRWEKTLWIYYLQPWDPFTTLTTYSIASHVPKSPCLLLPSHMA